MIFPRFPIFAFTAKQHHWHHSPSKEGKRFAINVQVAGGWHWFWLICVRRCTDHPSHWTWSLHPASVLELPTELTHSLGNKMNWYSHTEVVHIAGKNSICTSVNHFATVWQDARQHPPNRTALNLWMKFWLEQSTAISEQQHWKAGQGMAHKVLCAWKEQKFWPKAGHSRKWFHSRPC